MNSKNLAFVFLALLLLPIDARAADKISKENSTHKTGNELTTAVLI